MKLTHNTSKSSSSTSETERASFVCPLNFKEMNGSQPFVYLQPCGCVFSQAGLKAVSRSTPPSKSPGAEGGSAKGKEKDTTSLDLCPQCGAKYDRASDILVLNPSPELEQEMRAAMEARRLLEPAKTKGKKRKAAAEAASEPPSKKQAAGLPSTNSSVTAASRVVAQELAKEEAKRKAAMSDAVKSLYTPKDGSKKKETFMTMGTFTRVRSALIPPRGIPFSP